MVNQYSMAMTALLCVTLVTVVSLATSTSTSITCPADKTAVYKIVLHTFWTRDNFPKHYPDWRPPAQWAMLHGRSHDSSYLLYRLGEKVSASVRAIAEGHRPQETAPEGHSISSFEADKKPPLALEAQGSGLGILDIFTAPPITQGAGRTEAEFFVDGNHSMVSLISRMIPSPDWFIGLDSFDLCVNGNWLDTITIELDPLDAGTDNGFTFTAPNWPTQPQGVAYKMTARYPAHPAGSFFYPHIKRLPPIATLQFLKMREYEVSEVFQHAVDEKKYEVVKMEQPVQSGNSINLLDGNHELSVAIEEERQEQEIHGNYANKDMTTILDQDGTARSTPDNKYIANNASYGQRETNEVATGDKAAILNSITKAYKQNTRKRMSKEKKIRSRDCRVSSWGEWSACSKSCGIGETRRTRSVVREGRKGGRACPPLVQTRWCGSARDCQQNYFNW